MKQTFYIAGREDCDYMTECEKNLLVLPVMILRIIAPTTLQQLITCIEFSRFKTTLLILSSSLYNSTQRIILWPTQAMQSQAGHVRFHTASHSECRLFG